MKNTGVKNTPKAVTDSIPPMTPIPTAFWLPDPAPLLRASGSTPSMKAKEVIKIGRMRSRHASTAASRGVLPSS